MPNGLIKCSFCDDPITTDDNDSNLCGACADGLRAEKNRLMAEIAELKADNSSLVEQMNEMTIKYESLEQHCIALEEDINMWQASGAMALKPNQEVIDKRSPHTHPTD